MKREAIGYKILRDFNNNSREDILKEAHGLLKDRFDKKVRSSRLLIDSDILIDHLRIRAIGSGQGLL